MSPITSPAPFFPKVFISHAIDDPDWPQHKVLELAEAIATQLGASERSRVYLDYWHEQAHGVLSTEDWIRFMEKSIEDSEVILILGSIYYFEAGAKETANRGFGVAFENILLSHWLYNQKHQNQRRIRLLYPGASVSDKPQNLPQKLDWTCPQYPYPTRKADLLTDIVRPRAALAGETDTSVDMPADLSEKEALEAELAEPQKQLLALILQRDFVPSKANKTLFASVAQLPAYTNWVTYALSRYAQAGIELEGMLHYHYVRLQLSVPVPQDLNAAEAQNSKYSKTQELEDGDLESLVRDEALHLNNHAAKGWRIVGEPGSGKTTLLKHFEMRQLRTNLWALAQQGVANTSHYCIWLPLGEYKAQEGTSDLGAAWQQWVEDKCQPLIRSTCTNNLMDLLTQKEIRFLFDAANEVGVKQGQTRGKQIAALIQWFASLKDDLKIAKALPAPIFSVRTNDKSVFGSLRAFELVDASVKSWDDAQIETYIRRRLPISNAGKGHGRVLSLQATELIDHLRHPHNKRLLEAMRSPIFISGQCDLLPLVPTPVTDIASLFCGLTWLRMTQIAQSSANLLTTLCESDFLFPTDAIAVLNDGTWRNGDIRTLPDHQGCDRGALLPALAYLAWHMRSQAMSQLLTDKDLRSLLTNFLISQNRSQIDSELSLLLTAFDAAGLMVKTIGTDVTQWKFVHELWQEFFAARYMVRHTEWPEIRMPNLRWTAGVERLNANTASSTAWEEPLKLAAQMAEPPAAWFCDLVQHNLPLAGRLCAAAQLAGQAWAAVRKPALAKALLDLQSSDAPLPLRLDAGLALGQLGDDIRYERPWGNAPCILPKVLPKDQYWIPVTAKKDYLLGSAVNDPDAFDWEKNAKPINIKAFHMAFAPVTNAEYEKFIEDGGYTNDQWWCADGLTWRNGSLPRYGEMIANRTFRSNCTALGRGVDWALKNVYLSYQHDPDAWAAEVKEWITDLQTEKAFEAYLVHKFEAPGTAYTEPLYWRDSNFNQALQPVVGVCVYEAEAYVRWINSKNPSPNRVYALPTEAQWEACARGDDRRTWPWVTPEGFSAKDLGKGTINHVATVALVTTPVGLFANANTPEGCVDIAGNVWEWTASQAQVESAEKNYLPKDYTAGAANHPVEGGNAQLCRVVRGGSWNDSAQSTRPACRDRSALDDRDNDLGFRLMYCPMTLNPGH